MTATKFGQYELLERIAVGGMAEVFRGRAVGAEGFEKFVAIKRVLPDLGRDSRFVEMLLTEARIHAGLSHRNIVQIHDLGQSEEGEYFIVLEYVEGRDLRSLLDALAARRERLGDGLALFVAAELAQGLHFAHDLAGPDGKPLGLVHRDVSPSNVLLSYAGEVKLSDFGLAKRREDRSVIGTLKGKLAYMSPEQARRASLDRRTDIFALGAVLFEMLAGRRLREITDEVEGFRLVASGRVPSLRSVRPDLPDSADRLLSKALAADPEQRFADAAAFGVAIREVALQMAPAAAAPGAAELASSLSRALPPGSPRTKLEHSKVIRLASELPRALPPPVPPAARGPAPAPPAAPALKTPGPRPRAPTPGRPTSPSPPASAVPPPVPAAAMPPPLPAPALAPRVPASAGPPPFPPPSLPEPVPASAGPPPFPPASLPEPLPPPARPSTPAVIATRPQEKSLTAVVGRPNWGLRLLLLALIAVAGASVVHVAVIPLDVLVVWPRPTSLHIASVPDGAEVWLDGNKLPGLTPTQIAVHRDRRDHLVEVVAPAFGRARQSLRYDRAVLLEVDVRLPRQIRPAIQPLLVPAVAPVLASDGGGSDGGGDAGRTAVTVPAAAATVPAPSATRPGSPADVGGGEPGSLR